jgi:hypothetical protein
MMKTLTLMTTFLAAILLSTHLAHAETIGGHYRLISGNNCTEEQVVQVDLQKQVLGFNDFQITAEKQCEGDQCAQAQFTPHEVVLTATSPVETNIYTMHFSADYKNVYIVADGNAQFSERYQCQYQLHE